MPRTDTGIYYEVTGESADPAVILIEGFTVQLLGWREEFCRQLLQRHLRVIRMDNRDVGLSKHYRNESAYGLSDMADDVLSVLDHLGLAAATVVGQSMGGMIAQLLAIAHPSRVDALVLFYTTPSIRYLRVPEVLPDLSAWLSREEAIREFISRDSATASPEWGYDLAWKTRLAADMYDRDYAPDGYVRQQHAIEHATSTEHLLPELTMPVSIVHGHEDLAIDPRASLRIAELVDHAELHLYPGMGHEIARALWDDFANIIERAVERASATPFMTTG